MAKIFKKLKAIWPTMAKIFKKPTMAKIFKRLKAIWLTMAKIYETGIFSVLSFTIVRYVQ